LPGSAAWFDRRVSCTTCGSCCAGRGSGRCSPPGSPPQAGDGAFQTGLAGLFFFSPERSTTATDAAVAFAVAVLPYTLVGPFAGLVLDRWRRRKRAPAREPDPHVLVLGVALLVTVGASDPLLYVAVLACLSVNRFFLAGLGASLPHVVAPDELVMADAVSPTSGTVATLLGAAAGYALHTMVGSGPKGDAAVLVASATAYLASSALAARMAPDLLGPDVAAGAAEPPDGSRRPGTACAASCWGSGRERGTSANAAPRCTRSASSARIASRSGCRPSRRS
jgi:MFS family permease